MHDSRMMAVVVPPGPCAIEKVSGSRIATPFAPPSPGSTPMITPSSTPTNMNAMFFSVSAMAKPCIRDWISSMFLSQPENRLQRPLGQRNHEPDFKNQEKKHAVPDRKRHHLPPLVFAQPAHEKSDEKGRSQVDAQPLDKSYIHYRRNKYREHQLQLPDLDEDLVALGSDGDSLEQIHDARDTDDQGDVERKIAGLRPVFAPLRAQTPTVERDNRPEHQEYKRHDNIHPLVAGSRPLARTFDHARSSSLLLSVSPLPGGRCAPGTCAQALFAGDKARGFHQRKMARLFFRNPVGVGLAVERGLVERPLLHEVLPFRGLAYFLQQVD